MTGAWDGIVRLRGETLGGLATVFGGWVVGGSTRSLHAIVPVVSAGAGDLTVLLSGRLVGAARAASARGAAVLVDARIAPNVRDLPGQWIHKNPTWAMAMVLDRAYVPDVPAAAGPGCVIAPSAVLGPRVVLGARVTIAPGAVVGWPGFGWASTQDTVRPVPQLGGVFVGDDVSIGPLTTVDAGTLGPTRIGRGVKLDAHVHVGHNCAIGEGTIIAAQAGFAGSVTLGRNVRVGGQAGFADHVTVGDGARISAGAGVIGDVAAGAVMAGYPAVPRMRWLRGLARLYREMSVEDA